MLLVVEYVRIIKQSHINKELHTKKALIELKDKEDKTIYIITSSFSLPFFNAKPKQEYCFFSNEEPKLCYSIYLNLSKDFSFHGHFLF